MIQTNTSYNLQFHPVILFLECQVFFWRALKNYYTLSQLYITHNSSLSLEAIVRECLFYFLHFKSDRMQFDDIST